MDAISESRLAQVHPVLAARVRALESDPAASPFDIRVTRGISTVAEQDAIWQEGRAADGKVVGRTVTNARGTQSNHVLGFAVDLVVMNADGTCDWAVQPWVALAANYKLRSGAAWGDRPHLELIEVPADPTPESQQVYLAAGVEVLWSETTIEAS